MRLHNVQKHTPGKREKHNEVFEYTGQRCALDAAEAIKMGLSRDGGLLTPSEIPQIDQAFLESLVNVRIRSGPPRSWVCI